MQAPASACSSANSPFAFVSVAEELAGFDLLRSQFSSMRPCSIAAAASSVTMPRISVFFGSAAASNAQLKTQAMVNFTKPPCCQLSGLWKLAPSKATNS